MAGAMMGPAKLTDGTRVHVRWMIRRDIPEVLAIEADLFENHWDEEDFLRVLRERNCIGVVEECDDRVVAFIVYELHTTRLQILNFAVQRELHRRGMGRVMIEGMIRKLAPQRRARLVLKIRETNLDAQMFFRAMVFRAMSVLKGFYDDSDEDAYVFQFRLGNPGQPAAELPFAAVRRFGK